MENLPADVLVRIFTFLDVKDKCKAARVCRSWNHLTREKQLWRYVEFPCRVDLRATWKIIRCYFTNSLKSLHLRGFMYSIKRNTECISNAVLINLCERCPNIEELHLEDATLTSIDSGNLPPSLKVLKLYRCVTTLDWFKSAIDNGRFNKLQTLDVTRSTRFCNSDLEFFQVLPSGGELKSLNFSNCYRINRAGFQSMAENLVNLTHLNITSTCVDDTDIHFVCRNLKKLESLILQECTSLTDLCVGSLATLTSLRTLDLSGSKMNITGDAIVGLMSKLIKLEHLNVSLSKTLTEAELEKIQGMNVKCQIKTL